MGLGDHKIDNSLAQELYVSISMEELDNIRKKGALGGLELRVDGYMALRDHKN